jgi:hypothetical protein
MVGNVKTFKKAEQKFFSQNNEDGVIHEIFKRMGIKNGNFLEFGAETGAEVNCRLLAKAGWGGVFLECDEDKHSELTSLYENLNKVVCIKTYVTNENINEIITQYGKPIDLISIDIDGLDYQIFEAIDHKPILFIVEYNGQLPLEKENSLVNTSPDWDFSANYGASLGALEKIAKTKGYSLIYTESHGVNAFFIRNDKLDFFPEYKNPARHIANHYGLGVSHPGLDLSTFIEY